MWRRLSTSTGAAGGVAAILFVGAAAVAQQSSRGGVVLHEYFEPTAVDESSGTSAGGGRGRPAGRAANAEEAPGLTLDPGGGDVILGPEGPVDGEVRRSPYGPRAPRGGGSKLDSKTSRVDDLNYFASFDPSVFPYKRNVAQNRAIRTPSGEYRFETEGGRLERVAVEGGGVPAPGENAFWGTFLVRARSGAKHPIPSVAANQRILAVRSEPETDVEFFRDRAGNYYVELDYDGLVRLNVHVAAPRFYFTGRFEGDVRWSEFADGRGTELEAEIREVAGEVASQIGVDRGSAPAEVVRRLVSYYRNFRTEGLPEAARNGDLYREISTRQIGVCRHRSMGFVLTARYLGIPAHYVTNEAHAFVEIWWPEGGWRRIDLGGAAREISYNGDRDDQLHDAAERDPLPKPPRYRRELREAREKNQRSSTGGDRSSGGGSSGGAASDDRRESARGREDGRSGRRGREARRREERVAAGTDAGAASRRIERVTGRDAGTASPSRPSSVSTHAASGPDTGSSSAEEASNRVPTLLTLRTDARTVLRGGEITVQGRLRIRSGVAGSPLQGKRIELYFGRVGASPETMQRLGAVRTDRRGRYRVKVTVPETAGIGRWSLVARFPGGDGLSESVAR